MFRWRRGRRPGALPSRLGSAQRDMTNYRSHTIGRGADEKETSAVETCKGTLRATEQSQGNGVLRRAL